MSFPEVIVSDAISPDPPLSHRFGVFFFPAGPVPNPIDIRFQKVSGLSAEVTMDTINEGGRNLFSHRLPKKINYNNLVLERGLLLASPLNSELDTTFSLFQFAPSHVMVTLLGEFGHPLAGWLFINAYPVKWAIADFDAQANTVLVETMELAYTRFQLIKP
ncbi:MAG: phage tail protein [Williamsia sp.]|nr:phage tail protein [Williamsia sp.]